MKNLPQNLGRRKFLSFLFIGIPSFIILYKNEVKADKKNVVFLSEETINEIKIYNSKRKNKLSLNYQNEIKNDLKEGKTIWLENDLITYAQLKNFKFKKI